jgi:hypothetical protein
MCARTWSNTHNLSRDPNGARGPPTKSVSWFSGWNQEKGAASSGGRSTRSAVDKEEEISKSGHRHFDDEAYKNETVYKKASGVTESLRRPFKVSEEQTFFGDIQGETRDPAKRKDPDYRLDVEAAEPKQKKRRREGL